MLIKRSYQHFYIKIRKSGKRISSVLYNRQQKPWSTTQTLDRWHHRVERVDDQRSSRIDWGSRSLEGILRAANPSLGGGHWTTTTTTCHFYTPTVFSDLINSLAAWASESLEENAPTKVVCL